MLLGVRSSVRQLLLSHIKKSSNYPTSYSTYREIVNRTPVVLHFNNIVFQDVRSSRSPLNLVKHATPFLRISQGKGWFPLRIIFLGTGTDRKVSFVL